MQAPGSRQRKKSSIPLWTDLVAVCAYISRGGCTHSNVYTPFCLALHYVAVPPKRTLCILYKLLISCIRRLSTFWFQVACICPGAVLVALPWTNATQACKPHLGLDIFAIVIKCLMPTRLCCCKPILPRKIRVSKFSIVELYTRHLNGIEVVLVATLCEVIRTEGLGDSRELKHW